MPQSQSETLEQLIERLTSLGWKIHNLYQGQERWEARIKLQSTSTVYGYGYGSNAAEALQSAIVHGEERRNWRPRQRVYNTDLGGITPITTDELLKGLDL